MVPRKNPSINRTLLNHSLKTIRHLKERRKVVMIMTINLLYFIVTIKKVPRNVKETLQQNQQTQLHEQLKAKALEYRNHHLL